MIIFVVAFGKTVNGHSLTLRPGEVQYDVIESIKDMITGFDPNKIKAIIEAVKMDDDFARAKVLYQKFRTIDGPTIAGNCITFNKYLSRNCI